MTRNPQPNKPELTPRDFAASYSAGLTHGEYISRHEPDAEPVSDRDCSLDVPLFDYWALRESGNIPHGPSYWRGYNAGLLAGKSEAE